MAVRKYVRFSAPYRSKTFNDKDSLLLGASGVLTGGEVSQSGPVVTIQPITIVQNGQIVDISTSLSATAPATISAPYFIAISISSPIENVGEIITPVFVKRPQDINSNMVLVAEYDGAEWVGLAKLQVTEQVISEQERALVTGQVGIADGFDATQDLTTVTVQPGTLIDVLGRSVTKTEETVFTKVDSPSDPNLHRVDSIIYRRPLDYAHRPGKMEYVVGPAFKEDNSLAVVLSTNMAASADTRVVVNKIAGETLVFFLDGTTLKANRYDASLTIISSVTFATGVGSYDVSINPSGGYEVSYTNTAGIDLLYAKYNSTGSVVAGPTTLITGSALLFTPKIVTVKSGSTYFVHVVVAKEISITERTLRYIRISEANTIETADTLLVDLNSLLANHSLNKSDDDSLIYMAFDNTDTGRSYLYTFDASTATSVSAPSQVSSPLELQDEVYSAVTSSLLATTGSLEPRVLVADNKEVYVVWRHFVSAGNYGIAIYNKNFKSDLGYKAYVVSNYNVGLYSASIDGLNNLYLGVADNTLTDAVIQAVNLNNLQVKYTESSLSSGAFVLQSTGIEFTANGELILAFVDAAGASCFVRMHPASEEVTQREIPTTPTDTPIASIRRPDETLYVSDTIPGEHQVVKRIYELMSMCAATGTVSWNVVGANKLSIIAPISLRFFNKDCTLTIAANVTGITIPSNSALVVEIPDTDESQTLIPFVSEFGEGLLDREGKKNVILFWNIGGVLYTRFAPFRLSSDGETIVIGNSMSEEMISWLGASDATPDPSNHAYSSVTYILQSDSHNTAIGKLDQALTDYSNAGASNIIPLTMGTDSISIVFGAPRSTALYRPIPAIENLIDTDPMIFPTIITQKTVNGFTVKWPTFLDTGNYSLDYILRDPP